ncbi:GGDEF domain-containing protein [Marinilactibacillus piezotolerans]|uniref:GGDEF domain-containing protein n=1 Tax=Marinilactibacillus piezotolerans TaxID=258723 RepID=UPI0009B1091F|nr:sensor domain-containing diguanylate cyclase [Marinilactibacillus piezotolerans]
MTENILQQEVEDLKKELESVKRLNKELLKLQEEQDSLDFAWSGNLGHWYWDFTVNRVTFNPMKAMALGFTKEELPEYVDFQFFTDRLHPDDYERVMDAMRDHLSNKTPVWEVRYRIKTKDGQYRTYYDRGKVTKRSDEGAPLFLSGIVFDITDYEDERRRLLEENKEWAIQSRKDSLTGLYNRANILFELGKLVNEAQVGADKTLSILLLDIDNLSHQNSLFGPLFGDEIIKKASQIIEDTIKPEDLAGNFEGGKFMIVMPNTTKDSAHQTAERIRQKLASADYSEPAEVTSSAGIAQYMLKETVSQLFNRADRMLYKVKTNGKNQVES